MRFWRRPTQSEQNIERLLSAYVEQGTFSGAVCVMQAGDVEFRFVHGPSAAIMGIDMDWSGSKLHAPRLALAGVSGQPPQTQRTAETMR